MPWDPTLRALNHFGLGARIGERRRIADARAWLRDQLEAAPPHLPAPDGAAPDEVAAALRAVRALGSASQDEREEARQRLARIAVQESRAALTRRVASDAPLVERLVAFWSNHLCVSAAAKPLVAPLAGSYEREAIRPHVLGRFEEMVLASARHPAMLLYLDNFQSIGPTSPAARLPRRGGAARGLNENYSRELLELHTLGVDGGYGQRDVTELARVLTGWTVAGFPGPGAATLRRRADGPLGFLFQDPLHEPGAKTVLGARYEEGGVREGEVAIAALCRHPATASFVATKLATHFIADRPPPSAVDRLARTFRESDGDLRAVARTLVDLPEAWSAESRKFRPPQDWLVAVLRALAAPEAGAEVAPLLRQLRQPLWGPPAPKGFGDTAQEWADPDALLNRAELARTLSARVADRGVDPRLLLDVVDVGPADPLRALLSDDAIPAAERIALAIAGPAFQWR
jgi:uncharacterized protein (DUF1800 family)